MPGIRISEGASGILTIHRPFRKQELFIPSYDLDAACDLLFRIYEVKGPDGRTFKESYRRNGHNWLCGQLDFFFSRCLYRIVQYRELLARMRARGETPVFRGKGGFHKVWELLHQRPRRALRDIWAYGHVLPAHNEKLSRTIRPQLLFYRYGPNDFRTREMLAHLDEKGVDFAFVYSPSRKLISRRDTHERPVYFLYDKPVQSNAFARHYDLSAFDADLQPLLAAAIAKTEERMTADMADCSRHKENLARMRPKAFFALEDYIRLHPLLFACEELGIPSVGYQTGTYTSRQPYIVLQHWQPDEVRYFDHLIIWGSYWENVCRTNSPAFADDYFILGANKHTYTYRRLESPNFDVKNVLVPFEYLANTWMIGRYIEKLLALGYRVYFKLKPDWPAERQLACYHLAPADQAKLILAPAITDEFMAEINIVAGSMTTLLFDLLPYGKETWVLRTDYRLLDDLVAAGYARHVSLEDLETMPPPAKADRYADYTRIFNPGKVTEVLDRILLPLL